MEIITGNNSSLTLHIRMTKKCNADCSYCSSFQISADNRMELSDLSKSLDFLSKFIIENKLGGNREMITVQYVGGEISILPMDYIKEFTDIVKDKLSPLFKLFRHGTQTNLICSKDRILNLLDIFGSNIGTSFDNHTEQRTILGNSKKYKTIFLKNQKFIKQNLGKNIAGIIVIDEKMEPYIFDEILIAEKNRADITLRPVFKGGMPIEQINDNDMINLFSKIFDNWFLKSDIVIEPFNSLLHKRFLNKKNQMLAMSNKLNQFSAISGCPFQHNCALTSINLEPNGDLFVCLDMADSNNFSFGNALTGVIEWDIFNRLKQRSEHLNNNCYSCDYFNECQGGCMNEGIEYTGEMYGKTHFCSLWKMIFSKIDNKLQEHSFEEVEAWINKINQKIQQD